MILELAVFLLLNTGRDQPRPVPQSSSQASLGRDVQQVMPGSGDVHENLLRFSVRFRQPPSGNVLSRLRIVNSNGTDIDKPFLQQELWSPDGRTLTVLFGPGRIKTGLVAHDTLGRPLHAGETVSLQIDNSSIARWRVTGEYIHPLEPRDWKLILPASAGVGAFRLHFPNPVDGMDANLILIVHNGRPLPGTAALNSDQTEWTFTPNRPWRKGQYSVLVHPHLEDPYGNEPESAFEVPEPSSARSEPHPLVIPFSLP